MSNEDSCTSPLVEVAERIYKLSCELDDWYHVRRNLREQLDEIDKEIMSRNREKWSLEREIVRTKYCPPVKAPSARSHVSRHKSSEIKITDLSQASVKEILRRLRQLKEEENV